MPRWETLLCIDLSVLGPLGLHQMYIPTKLQLWNDRNMCKVEPFVVGLATICVADGEFKLTTPIPTNFFIGNEVGVGDGRFQQLSSCQ